ncbi:hypothetical protein [Aurantiacibacter aquimixticola]|nr:hypothetical protein [Aurantiacibacter aquimixticola]
MKIIKSLEQLLYELMVWIVFYPLTLWRSIVHPLRLMDYADEELADAEEDRYSDSLSPPIFLAISLGLIHIFELAQGLNVVSDGVFADDRNLIAFRLVFFALFPLMLSLRMLRAQGRSLDRNTLRLPFYAQCFVAAPFALGWDVGILFIAAEQRVVGLFVMAAVSAWYLWVQSAWFARMLGVGRARGGLHALRGFGLALVLGSLLSLAVAGL